MAEYFIPMPLLTMPKKSDSAVEMNQPFPGLRQRNRAADQPTTESEPASDSKEIKKILIDRSKFTLSAWKFTNFSITSLVGLTILSTESWMWNPPEYYANFESQTMSPLLIFFYQIGFASYAYATLSVFIETRQKDFSVMITHHLTTLFLIYMSFMTGFFRVGSAILLVHEVSDPFMEIAKMFLYAGAKVLADAFFALFALVFIATRNVIFPLYVISSIPLYCHYEDGRAIPDGKAHIRDSAFVGLCVLEALHMYWAYLVCFLNHSLQKILKMVKIAVMSSGVQDDIRNEEE